MKKIALFTFVSLALLINVFGLAYSKAENTVFQVSSLDALISGGYSGTITCKELKEKGDFGIGTFDKLDGEMLILDGIVYKISYDGSVLIADDEEKVPYAKTVFFKRSKKFRPDKQMGMRQLENFLNYNLPTINIIYAIKISGTFEYVKTRSVPKQEKPYKKLSKILEKQSEFEFENIEGTLVGFRFPDFMEGVSKNGYHFHFISDDKKYGGHLLDIAMRKALIEVQNINAFELMLPDSREYYNLNMEKVDRDFNGKKTGKRK